MAEHAIGIWWPGASHGRAGGGPRPLPGAFDHVPGWRVTCIGPVTPARLKRGLIPIGGGLYVTVLSATDLSKQTCRYLESQ